MRRFGPRDVTLYLLLALMAVLAVNSVLLEGAGEGLRFYLQPNFHNLVYDGEGKSFPMYLEGCGIVWKEI